MRKVSVIGLGYVGLPVAVAFGQKQRVIGFDISATRVNALKQGLDETREVKSEALKATDIHFTTEPNDLRTADFHIVAVPTPVDAAKQPDLTPVLRASETVGKVLKTGDIVVFESTVYPGATEEDCVPVLEKFSGLKCGRDFFVGYSPERINPGDHEHSFTRITKVVSGQNAAVLEIVAGVYESVVTAGVHRAPSIRVAESAKVIENIQRDVNIALMNELALIFHKMNIDTQDVLAAARTKWNFLPFTPGLVGGHCIGVDPYYLTHKAAKVGYTPEVILAGRRINDGMGGYVASEVVKGLIRQERAVHQATVTILGFTFKENVPDLRNTKVIDIIAGLKEYGIRVQVQDSVCSPAEAKEEYGIELTPMTELKPADAIVLAVSHREYVGQPWSYFQKLLKDGRGLLFDIKGVVPRVAPQEINLWRL